MNNKEKLEEQANKLQVELDKLKSQIKDCDKEDPYTCTTYSELCGRLGEQEYHLGNVSNKNSNTDVVKALSLLKIKQLERYFNTAFNFNIDWNNTNQYKYYPYFNYSKNEWSFSGVYDFDCYSHGEPGFFKDEKTVKHIIKYFKDIYIDYLNN